MPCPIEVQDVFGPSVATTCRDGFDFTLLFEQLILTIVPAAVFSLIIPVRLWRLFQRSLVFRPSLFQYIKLGVHAAYIIIQLTQLIILCIPGHVPKTRASIASAVLVLYTSLLCVPLSHLEHLRSVRPSTLLSLYYGLTVLFDIVQSRTLWSIPGNGSLAAAFTVGVVFKFGLLVAESLEKRARRVPSAYDDRRARETSGSVFMRGLFLWMNPLMWMGFRNVLTVECLPATDTELGTPDMQRRLWSHWLALPVKTGAAMVKLIIATNKGAVLQGVLPRLMLSGFTFAQPFLITAVIDFATKPETPSPDKQDNKTSKQMGDGLIVATVIIYVGLAISNANAQHKCYRVSTALRANLLSLIYNKLLGVSLPTAQDSSAVTLMGPDVERSQSGLRFLHEVWASPLDLGLNFWLLQRQLGASAAAPGVLFVMCSVLGLKVAASMGIRQRHWLEAIDRRIKATSNTLSSMKEVRMGGLQHRAETQLEDLRKREVYESRPFKNALALIVCLSYTTAAMGPVFSFGIYSLLAKRNGTPPLSASQGFTALSIFSLLRTPMSMMLDALGGLVGTLGAMQRIGDYVATESHVPGKAVDREAAGAAAPATVPQTQDAVSDRSDSQNEKRNYKQDVIAMADLSSHESGSARSTPATLSPDPRIIHATKYSAGWDKERGLVLHDLDFSVLRGSLTFVVGPVGSGKSTLLHSILGETTLNEGALRTSFDRAAFVGQAPWIISDTIQNNIIGTCMFEKDWYAQVVFACALRDDIDRMPRGDQEMVDSGGSNLSGGQKARLGIARAVYSRHQVIVLDDVLSGLDARTEQILFNNLLGPHGLLRGGHRTTVFATNAINRLSAGDHIIVLGSDGSIVEQGTYEELESITKHSQASGTADAQAQAQAEAPSESIEAAMQMLALQKTNTADISDLHRRTGDLTIYKYYAKAVGYLNFAVFVFFGILFVVALIFPQYLVQWWTAENARHPNGKLGLYLGGYFAAGWLAIIGLAGGCLQLVVVMMPRASYAFHTTLLRTAFDAPLSLFSGSNVGETVNRFAQDLQLIDMELPLALFNTSFTFLFSVGNLVVIAIAAKYIGAALPAVLVVFFVVQLFYLRTARQLRLLDIEAKAPLVSHFLETSSGLAAIRAYGAEADYEQRLMDRLEYSQKPNYLLWAVQRWLNLVLDLIVAGIAILFITVAIKAGNNIDPSLVGTALVGIVNFSTSIKALLENWTSLEMCIGAVSRVRTFSMATESEHKPGEDYLPPSDWPSRGNISYMDVTAAWPGKDTPAIKELSLTVESGQKLAICGRTGSGKSSLVSVIFRLLEAQRGSIIVDGVDLAVVPRQVIRERIICVPQAPFLLTGTVRENIDPFNVSNDGAIMTALRQVQMLEVVQTLGGLDALVDGDTLSLGQKQLLCLARAALRPGSVLVLDEATASLDWDTDAIVKEVIRTVFHRHTVIAIVHRVWSIIEYDRVAVISDGGVAEYGVPGQLLDNPSSLFAELCRISAGDDDKDMKSRRRHTRVVSTVSKRRRGESFARNSLIRGNDDIWAPLENTWTLFDSSYPLLRRLSVKRWSTSSRPQTAKNRDSAGGWI